MSSALLRALLTTVAGACLAAMVHVLSILLMPKVAPNDAFARLAARLPAGEVHVLPPASAAASPTPFRDPLLASAVCRYDLGQGTMRITAEAPGDAFLAVSFHSREGLAFYGLTDRASTNGKIEVILMSAPQQERIEAAEAEDAPVKEVRVTAPSLAGFVEFDVLPRVGGLPEAERALRSVGCALDRRF